MTVFVIFCLIGTGKYDWVLALIFMLLFNTSLSCSRFALKMWILEQCHPFSLSVLGVLKLFSFIFFLYLSISLLWQLGLTLKNFLIANCFTFICCKLHRYVHRYRNPFILRWRVFFSLPFFSYIFFRHLKRI